jgi:hypothetical protein
MKRSGRTRLRAVVAVVLLVLLGGGSAAAQTAAPRQGTFELYLGQYNIAEPLFKTIYQPGGSILGLGLTANLFSYFDFYLEIKGMSKTGLLSYSQEKTSFVLIPISLGLRAAFPVAFVIPFAGVGLDYFVYYEKNPIGTTLNYTKGWHLQGGTYLSLGRNFPILPFLKAKWSLVKATLGTRTIDLGGIEFGAGLAVAF